MTNPLLEVVDLAGVARFCQRAQPHVDHRQHVRDARQLPAGRARLRPRRAQRHEVPQRSLGHRRRRRRRQGDARAGGEAQARPPGRLARSARVLPPPPRPQDPRAARPPPEREHTRASRGSSRRTPRCPACTTPGSRATRAPRARAEHCSAASAGSSASSCGAAWPAAERLIARLKLPANAPSLGGVETLITRPATTSHAGLSRRSRAALGIVDGLVRLSVGLEAPEDLIEDLGQALAER